MVSACPPIVWAWTIITYNASYSNCSWYIDLRLVADASWVPGSVSCLTQRVLDSGNLTGVWVSGNFPQTDSKAVHAIWCLSNSQRNSRNLKQLVQAFKKNNKEWTKVCPKPSAAEGSRDECWAGGLSQIHTVIQMAKMLKLLNKQVNYLNWLIMSDGSGVMVVTEETNVSIIM